MKTNINITAEDIANIRIGPTYLDAADKARVDFFNQVTKDATSAIAKRNADELTEQEKFALAYFARVPMQQQDMRAPSVGFTMTTVPCGFFHDGEKWIVTMRSEDER